MRSLPKSEPSIRKEVIDVAHVGVGKASENVLEIFKGVDFKTFAGLDERHEDSASMTSVERAGKEPVGAAKDDGLDGALASIVRDVDEAGVSVETKCIPAVKSVRDGVGELGFRWFFESVFVEPSFEKSKFWFCQPYSHVFALFFGEVLGHTFDIKETFDNTHGKFDSYLVVEPGVFKTAVNMGPAVSRSGSSLDYPVELVCAVGEKNALEAIENFFRIHGVFGFGEIVDCVGIGAVAKHGPEDAAVSFTKTIFDDRQSGGISQYQTTPQEEYLHPFNDGMKKIRAGLEPAAHRCAIDRNTKSLEDFFLTVERQVEQEFISSNFSKQSWCGLCFTNWLNRLFSREDIFAAVFAAVFVDDVFNLSKNWLDEVSLSRDVKAEDGSFITAARAGEQVWIGDSVLFFAKFSGACGSRGASTTFIFRIDDIEITFFVFEFLLSLRVDSFACAGEEGGVDLGGLFAVGSAVAAAELFFESDDASEEFTNEVMAIGDVVGQFVGAGGSGSGSLFRHFNFRFKHHYILQYAPRVIPQKTHETSIIGRPCSLS